MWSNAGVQVSAVSYFFGWLLGLAFVWLNVWLVGWFTAFSLDCFTLENYRLSQKSAYIIGIATEDCNRAQVTMFKYNIK